MRGGSLVVLLLGLGLAGCAPHGDGARKEPPPSFILISADDLSAGDCSPFGSKFMQTPRLERLAREGMRFTRAFLTSGSCSPSRCSTLTGRYPHATGAGRLHDPLPPSQVTFLEGLRQAGYDVAIAGKWHFGREAKSRFDRVYAETGPGGTGEWLRALRERPQGKPFFLWLSASDPHRPYGDAAIERPHRPEEVEVPPYLPDAMETRLDLARYYDAVSRLDQAVGDALDEIDRQGIAANTLVLFLSDNGRPFPRCKPTLYDCGIQTPLIVKFPGRARAGETSEAIVSAVDIAPTFLDLAGVAIPETMQGRSFAPVLRDPRASIREEAFAEHNWHDHPARERMVRTKDYKYIRNFYPELQAMPPEDVARSPTYHAMLSLRAQGSLKASQANCFLEPRPVEELYDVAADPHELRNLAADAAHAEVLEKMRAALARWARETDDRDILAAPGR